MLSDSLFVVDDFMRITPDLVREFDGDLLLAAVCVRIRFRTSMYGRADDDGVVWWRASQQELADDIGVSIDRIQKAVKKLIEAGHVATTKQRAGRLGSGDHVLSYRIVTVSADPRKRDDHSADPRGTSADWRRPSADPRKLVGEEVEDSKEEELLVAEATDLFGVPEIVKPDLDAEFEEWWRSYPRKVSKDAARKAWRSARKRASVEELTDGLERFCAQPKVAWDVRHKKLEFIPHAATWLNAGKWMDEPEVAGQDPRGAATVRDWEANGSFFGGR